MNTIMVIKSAFGVLGAGIGVFLGGMDGFLYALIVFVIVDYLTGVIAAIIQKRLSSAIGAVGIAKKVMIFALVGIGNALDGLLGFSGSPVRMAVIFFYIANEGMSILENAAIAGLPVPDKLKTVLSQINQEED